MAVGVGGCNRAQALDVFVQPAQESPFSKPSATIFQTHSLAACSGAYFSSPQPLTASLPVKWQKEPSPCRELSPWEVLGTVWSG